MTGFERAFDDAEKAAEAARKAATDLVRRANTLKKAALTGNIAAIRREQGRLRETLETLREEVSAACSCWPFSEQEEIDHMKDGYVAELMEIAAEKDLRLYERDRQLIAPPSIIRITPNDRSVKLDRKRVPTIRPSYLTNELIKNRDKSSGFASERFLESLYSVYFEITGPMDRMSKQGGAKVRLMQIYKLITALPGVVRDYDRRDFARDLYMLDVNGPRHTKKGMKWSLPSAGGKYNSRDVFDFVDPSGKAVYYHEIRFQETDA